MTAEFDIFFEYIMQVLYYCADISGSLFTYLFIHLLIFLFNKKRRQQLDDYPWQSECLEGVGNFKGVGPGNRWQDTINLYYIHIWYTIAKPIIYEINKS